MRSIFITLGMLGVGILEPSPSCIEAKLFNCSKNSQLAPQLLEFPCKDNDKGLVTDNDPLTADSLFRFLNKEEYFPKIFLQGNSKLALSCKVAL